MTNWEIYRAIVTDLEGISKRNPTFGEATGPIVYEDGQRVIRYESEDRKGSRRVAHVLPGLAGVKRFKAEGAAEWIDHTLSVRGYAACLADLYHCAACDAVTDAHRDHCYACGEATDLW